MSLAPVTLALGLRSTAQSLGVIGSALGLFARQGLDLQIVRQETAGPEGLRGLVEGQYQFAEFGAVPVVQAAIEGLTPMILLAVEPVSAMYVLGRAEMTEPARLAGGKIGVLSAAGQTGYSASQMIERWGLRDKVELVPLGKYPAIYQALERKEIDGGVLTADYKLAGEMAFGLRELADLGAEFGFQGPVLATTRRMRDAHPDLVLRMVRAYAHSVQAFKTRPDDVAPILRRHLGFVDEAQARAIQAFYARRFRLPPRASGAGIAKVIASFARERDVPAHVDERYVHDPSFIDRIAKEGA